LISPWLDPGQQAVLYKDQTIPLSQGDLGLLFVFLNNPRQVLSFQDIIPQKENMKLPEDRAKTRVRGMIHRLRSRLSDIPGGDQWIESVRGRGYIFNV
jgi:two-component system OmpR family response regulator